MDKIKKFFKKTFLEDNTTSSSTSGNKSDKKSAKKVQPKPADSTIAKSNVSDQRESYTHQVKEGLSNAAKTVKETATDSKKPQQNARTGIVERVWIYKRMTFTAKMKSNWQLGEFTAVVDGIPLPGHIHMTPKVFLEFRYQGPSEQNI